MFRYCWTGQLFAQPRWLFPLWLLNCYWSPVGPCCYYPVGEPLPYSPLPSPIPHSDPDYSIYSLLSRPSPRVFPLTPSLLSWTWCPLTVTCCHPPDLFWLTCITQWWRDPHPFPGRGGWRRDLVDPGWYCWAPNCCVCILFRQWLTPVDYLFITRPDIPQLHRWPLLTVSTIQPWKLPDLLFPVGLIDGRCWIIHLFFWPQTTLLPVDGLGVIVDDLTWCIIAAVVLVWQATLLLLPRTVPTVLCNELIWRFTG